MFTIASLFCGFYSIVAAIKGDFTVSATAILIAAVFDGVDGRIARLTGTTSTFGMELDSLCDLVSFGVAPGLLAFLWALQPFNRYGWLAGFLYVATTALRLARFNCQHTSAASKHFVGLPCPAAAAMISSTVLFSHYLGFEGTVNHISLLFLVYLLSYLMVSTHLYFSFKQTDSQKSKNFRLIIGTLLLFILVAAEHEVMLFLIFSVYIASGPIFAIFRRARKLFTSSPTKINNPSSQP
jgi:CDP-diacylglycerol---serine O-phosphatidyltransferase